MVSSWESISHFEELVANYAGSKYAIAVDCCTHALYLSLMYVRDIKSEIHDYIEIPKYTYLTLPSMVIQAGYKIRFIDSEWSGAYKLNPSSVIDSACRFTENMYQPNIECEPWYKIHIHTDLYYQCI